MPVQLTITGENGLDAATQVRNFLIGLQLVNPVPTAEQAAEGAVSETKVAPAPKAKAPVVEDEDAEEAPAPKKSAKKPVKKVVQDDEEEAPKTKDKSAEGKSSVGELIDDGRDQPATVDGCRIMIRRVSRAHDIEYAHAVLAEFGIKGAAAIPPKKMAAFVARCEEVVDDKDSIELSESSE